MAKTPDIFQIVFMPDTPTCRPFGRGLRSESGISKTCRPVPFPEGLIE